MIRKQLVKELQAQIKNTSLCKIEQPYESHKQGLENQKIIMATLIELLEAK